MGTSKGTSTPSGGGWTAAKSQITSALNGNSTLNANQLIGRVVGAAGGLGGMTGGSGGGGGGVGAGGGRSGGGGGGGSGSASVGGAVSGLAGFGSSVRDGGLDAAVERLGLNELRGRPAVEVIAAVAEHLAESADGPQADLVAAALRDTVLECVAVESDGSYDDLDAGLQSFIDREGIEGLVEGFLSHFVFDRVWAWIETHANERSEGVSDTQAMASAVQNACRLHVQDLVGELRDEGRFEGVDWFGAEGVALGRGIINTLEYRLESLQDEES